MPKAYPGIREILERHRAAGGIIAVVSHSMRENIERDYRENDLPMPGVIFGWEQPPEQRKPNPGRWSGSWSALSSGRRSCWSWTI